MKNSKLYCCYSVPLRDYLIQNGQRYEICAKNPNSDILKYLEHCKSARCTKVICITTGKIFGSVTAAANFYNCKTPNIHKCCNGKYKSCGQLPDGTKLQWMYYDEYIKKLSVETK